MLWGVQMDPAGRTRTGPGMGGCWATVGIGMALACGQSSTHSQWPAQARGRSHEQCIMPFQRLQGKSGIYVLRADEPQLRAFVKSLQPAHPHVGLADDRGQGHVSWCVQASKCTLHLNLPGRDIN